MDQATCHPTRPRSTQGDFTSSTTATQGDFNSSTTAAQLDFTQTQLTHSTRPNAPTCPPSLRSPRQVRRLHPHRAQLAQGPDQAHCRRHGKARPQRPGGGRRFLVRHGEVGPQLQADQQQARSPRAALFQQRRGAGRGALSAHQAPPPRLGEGPSGRRQHQARSAQAHTHHARGGGERRGQRSPGGAVLPAFPDPQRQQGTPTHGPQPASCQNAPCSCANSHAPQRTQRQSDTPVPPPRPVTSHINAPLPTSTPHTRHVQRRVASRHNAKRPIAVPSSRHAPPPTTTTNRRSKFTSKSPPSR